MILFLASYGKREIILFSLLWVFLGGLLGWLFPPAAATSATSPLPLPPIPIQPTCNRSLAPQTCSGTNWNANAAAPALIMVRRLVTGVLIFCIVEESSWSVPCTSWGCQTSHAFL